MSRVQFLACGLTVFAAAAHPQCPLSSISIGNVNYDAIAGPNASRSNAFDAYGTGTVRFVGWGDTLAYDVSAGDGFGGRVYADVRGQVTLVGLPAGTSVPVTANFRTRATIYGQIAPSGGNDLSLSWLADSATIFARFYRVPCDGQTEICSGAIDDSAAVVVEFIAGTPRALELTCLTRMWGFPPRQVVTCSRTFRQLPPGTFLVSCNGDTLAPPVLEAGPQPVNGLELSAPWPNPARGDVHVSCALPRAGTALLRLYDPQGRTLWTRVFDARSSSRQEVRIGSGLAAGTYFLQLKQGAIAATRLVTIVR